MVHPGEGTSRTSAPRVEPRKFFDPGGGWVGGAEWIRNEAGDVSGWHHHAANSTYVYVISGSVTFEFGHGGGESAVARAGDFVIVPPDTIHRETTGHEADLEAFVIRIGGEPDFVSVDGPEGAGSSRSTD